jgi:hypothetical protein
VPEQWWTIEAAVEVIPMSSRAALYSFLALHKDKFPARYRRIGGRHVARRGFQVRFLTESEIIKIREMTTIYTARNPTGRRGMAGRPPKRSSIDEVTTFSSLFANER